MALKKMSLSAINSIYLIYLLLQLVDGQDDVLEDLLGEGHGPDSRGGGQLHEGRLGWEHPAEEEEEERVVSKWDHRLQDPEDRLRWVKKKKVLEIPFKNTLSCLRRYSLRGMYSSPSPAARKVSTCL